MLHDATNMRSKLRGVDSQNLGGEENGKLLKGTKVQLHKIIGPRHLLYVQHSAYS